MPDFSALRVEGLRVALGGAQVLDGANLTVPSGQLVALLGPSGCGKTTLLRAVSGLERPTAGSVTVGDRLVFGPEVDVPAERRGIGMVFQDWALFPHLTVARNVGFGLSRDERRTGTIERTLALVGLAGFGQRLPATLSGGQQQRVALARALANRPAVLLLDEPFSNLDTALRTQVRAEVVALLRDLAVTALFVTHDQEEAFLLGDQVAVMFDGRIEQQGTAEALYETPATRRIAEFVGDANLLRGDAGGRRAHTPIGAVPLRAAARGCVDVLIRPEDVIVEPGTDAVITELEYYGHDAVYRLRTTAGAVLRARVLRRPELRPGDSVALAYCGVDTVAFEVPRRGTERPAGGQAAPAEGRSSLGEVATN